jgi:hypothetical protein
MPTESIDVFHAIVCVNGDYFLKMRSSGKNQLAYFPYISHLFEVLESN